MRTVAIIIPTYNAKETIIQLIRKIKSITSQAKIIIVDDNSPDGTGKKVISFFSLDKDVLVISRDKKQGRGSAVLYGFKEALKDKNIEYFIEMDSDLVHDPKYIPKLIEKAKSADIIIASKYHKQSHLYSILFKRLLLSQIMNIAARFLLGIPITDYSNGYRLYKRKVILYLLQQHIESRGFVVLSEIAYLSYKKGFTFSEIPIDFYYTPGTQSNFNTQEIKEAIFTLLRLFMKSGKK